MRRAAFVAAAALVMEASFARAQSKYPIFTVDHLDEAMKTVGLAYGLTRSAIDTNSSPDTAKDYLIRSRDQLATTITFWRDRKRDDAVAMLRATLREMDALDAALSEEPVDPRAVTKLAGSVAASCEACHAAYRERNPTSQGYRVRADAIR